MNAKARVQGHAGIGLPTVLRVEGPDGVLKETTSGSGETELAFEIEHRVDNSQWLMASAACNNQALANTTPVYVAVNGQPIWHREQGPQIIEKQHSAIAKIKAEFTDGKDARSVGVRERLLKAKAFYADLRAQMAQG
jgi:hypothetical protein